MRYSGKIKKHFLLLFITLLFFLSGCAGREESIKNTVQTDAVSVAVSNVADQSTEDQSDTIFITKTGTKYHRDGCRYLSQSKIPVDPNGINTKKYAPCSVCKPPAQIK